MRLRGCRSGNPKSNVLSEGHKEGAQGLHSHLDASYAKTRLPTGAGLAEPKRRQMNREKGVSPVV